VPDNHLTELEHCGLRVAIPIANTAAPRLVVKQVQYHFLEILNA
jgi:hypothetical protein